MPIKCPLTKLVNKLTFSSINEIKTNAFLNSQSCEEWMEHCKPVRCKYIAQIFSCTLLIIIASLLVKFEKNMHSWVSHRPQIALVLRTRALLRSLKNSLVRVFCMLHSKSCYDQYQFNNKKSSLNWNVDPILFSCHN